MGTDVWIPKSPLVIAGSVSYLHLESESVNRVIPENISSNGWGSGNPERPSGGPQGQHLPSPSQSFYSSVSDGWGITEALLAAWHELSVLTELLIGTQGHQEPSLEKWGEICLHLQKGMGDAAKQEGQGQFHILPEGGLTNQCWFPCEFLKCFQ